MHVEKTGMGWKHHLRMVATNFVVSLNNCKKAIISGKIIATRRYKNMTACLAKFD